MSMVTGIKRTLKKKEKKEKYWYDELLEDDNENQVVLYLQI